MTYNKTIGAQWKSFKMQVLDDQELENYEIENAELTFYAGATAVLNILTICSDSGMTVEEGSNVFKNLCCEARLFLKESGAFDEE